jgi:hypothetical protein
MISALSFAEAYVSNNSALSSKNVCPQEKIESTLSASFLKPAMHRAPAMASTVDSFVALA